MEWHADAVVSAAEAPKTGFTRLSDLRKLLTKSAHVLPAQFCIFMIHPYKPAHINHILEIAYPKMHRLTQKSINTVRLRKPTCTSLFAQTCKSSLNIPLEMAYTRKPLRSLFL